jgi:hypothetical protein
MESDLNLIVLHLIEEKHMSLRKLVQGLFLGATVMTTPLTDGEDNSKEYVAPNTVDVRGTWYEHGYNGGWYGPDKEWSFHFWSIRQYGTNIQGKFQTELYDSSLDITGTINSNKLALILQMKDETRVNLNVIIDGEQGIGKKIGWLSYYNKDTNGYAAHIERVSTNYMGRAPPKKKDK